LGIQKYLLTSIVTKCFNPELPDLVFELFRSVELSEIPDICPRVPKSDWIPDPNRISLEESGPPETEQGYLSESSDQSRRIVLQHTGLSRHEETSLEKSLHAREQSADSKQPRRPSQLLLQKTNSDQKLPSELKFIEGNLIF